MGSVPDRPEGLGTLEGHVISSRDQSLRLRLGRASLGDPDSLVRLDFSLATFSFVIGDVVERRTENQVAWEAARQTLDFGEWLVMIDSVPQLTKRTQELDHEGGFLITHAGQLQRTDGAKFSALEVHDVLDSLVLLLSFARGRWVSPVLTTGVDPEGRDRWTSLELWNLSRWRQERTWFPPLRHGVLADVASGVHAWTSTAERRLQLRLLIHTYIDAIELRTPELSLVLAQTALEMLADVYAVRTRKQRAAEAIGKTLKKAGIPERLPVADKPLSSAAASLRTSDGPELLTRLRNAFAHPTSSKIATSTALSAEERYQIRQLALWYVEMLILKKLGYTGVHLNRLARNIPWHQTEPVPWTP